MSAVILDGRATAASVRADLRARVERLTSSGRTPGLGTILVGDDPGSAAYVSGKHRDCAEIGIASIQRHLPASATQQQLLDTISELNHDPACTGYIVQLPLPGHLDPLSALEAVHPGKDADGLHPVSLGRLVLGQAGPLPCAPLACVELLRAYDIELEGAEVTVVGCGMTVGRPLGLLLTRRSENATVTLCHTGTRDLPESVRRADIVIAAAGAAGLIQPEWVRPGAAVVDVGITRVGGRLVGDVDPRVAEVAGYMSPMPGGIGPMTRAMLLRNVVELAESQRHGRR